MMSIDEKIKKVKELCVDDPWMLSFINDLEKDYHERTKKLSNDMKEMVEGLFKNGIPRDSSMYINF